jgi:predicted RNA-binding protein YlqC (UPF0109 family)
MALTALEAATDPALSGRLIGRPGRTVATSDAVGDAI